MSYTAVGAPQEFTCVAKQTPKPPQLWLPNRRRPLGDATATVMWAAMGALAVVSLIAVAKALGESYETERA